mmetsp:Transcript_91317/g.262948  ORF Transcript_91317/g.262948 Transcript_91317/m.262948 type:complete len:650 (+) Transcript_91317:174-2123(+)
MRFPLITLLTVLAASTEISAFVTSKSTISNGASRTTTELQAMPPMIIGPMIRKMREEKQKQKMPMASENEMKGQAPGLRVGGSAWKWPPVWPYDQTFFTPPEDLKKPDPTAQLSGMAGMLSGVAQLPTTPDESDVKEEDKLNIVQYWKEDKADVRTNLDEEAVEKLKGHLAYYIKSGMSILEFGAAENSYLPDDVKPSRHVGVGLSTKLMEENPSLTARLEVNLNNVIEGETVDSEELRQLTTEPFDAIIMTNTIDFLTHPREVYRTAWQLLKPGGIMIVAFTSKKAYPDKFERAQTKMWREFNDDQHMWIAGSFFQFSAGSGWENLFGFDISPESAKANLEKSGPLDFFKKGKENNMYVVQATKGLQDETIDPENPAKSINSKMWMMPTLEDRDKQLVVPRLARSYQLASTDAKKRAVEDHIALLPKIYDSLVKMDQFAFTFSMQSQLAADLVMDPDFDGNDEQINALKQGLGLRTPSPEFWQPVGETTSNMIIEDKINLLAHLVPRFGSGNPDQEQALLAFATGLNPTFSLIRSKCPGMSESDVQLLGTELLCSEILIPGRSTKQEFASWLGSMTEGELKDILKARREPNQASANELQEYREAREQEEREREELRRKYEEQVRKAREERSMAFNPKTGKFEEIQKKK